MDIFDQWGSIAPGDYTLELINGEIKKVSLTGATYNTQGQVLYLNGVDGKIYNWSVVYSIGPA